MPKHTRTGGRVSRCAFDGFRPHAALDDFRIFTALDDIGIFTALDVVGADCALDTLGVVDTFREETLKLADVFGCGVVSFHRARLSRVKLV